MIDVKQAVQHAKQFAADVLDQSASTLEEIEIGDYEGRSVWQITLSFPRDLSHLSPVSRLGMSPLQYKRFMVDMADGEVRGMLIRDTVAP